MHEGNPQDFAYDVMTGISAGAINTGAMSVWAKEDGLAMSEWLSEMWDSIDNHDIWKFWPDGIVGALTDEPSFIDDSPMLAFLRNVLQDFPEGVKRPSSMVGTVDANNAHYQRWFLEDIPQDKILDLGPSAIVSSASIPGVFPPTLYEGAVYVDGGTAMGLDAISAVENCLKIVED